MPKRRRIGGNGGPPIEDYDGPAWKGGDPHRFLHWKRAHNAAWKPKSRDIALFRLAKAEAVGLTYEEYTLELLERGHHLSAADADRVAEIKRKRRRRSFAHVGS